VPGPAASASPEADASNAIRPRRKENIGDDFRPKQNIQLSEVLEVLNGETWCLCAIIFTILDGVLSSVS
jgi:hypothetical protein